jgi:hypothetical protein
MSLMSSRKSSFTAAVLGAAMTVGSLSATASDSVPLEIGYEVYFSGMHILSVDAELLNDADRYELKVASVTRGITDFFVGWKGEALSRGVLAGDLAVPQAYTNRGIWKGKTRNIDIAYRPDGEVDSYKVVPEPDPEKVNDLPENAEFGTVDPLSVIAQVTRALNSGRSCDGNFAVFDGRRRYDVTVSDKGVQAIEPNEYSVYNGDAVVCALDFKVLGGDRKEKSKYAATARDRRVFVASPEAGGPAVPVRLQVETDYGTLMAHLTRFGARKETEGQTASR